MPEDLPLVTQVKDLLRRITILERQNERLLRKLSQSGILSDDQLREMQQ